MDREPTQPDDDALTEFELRLNEIIERQERWWFGDGDFEPETVNGSAQAFDGKFTLRKHGRYYADGVTRVHPDRFFDLVKRIGLLKAHANGIDPTTALHAVEIMRRLLDDLEHEAVAISRHAGWSWRAIAHVLNVDVAALHRRYARPEVTNRKRPRQAPRRR